MLHSFGTLPLLSYFFSFHEAQKTEGGEKMPDAVTVFIATYSITEMASRLDFLFKKSKTQEFPTYSWVFFCDKKNVITVTVLLV